jgi:ABC-type glycerol-3-phosphate transport system substrate-binding protein
MSERRGAAGRRLAALGLGAIATLALLALLGTPACAPPQRPDIVNGRVQVEFWHGMGGPLGKVLDRMIEDFNRSQSEIRVVGVYMGNYDTLTKKILASIVAGEQPDISQNFESLTLRLARNRKIVPLDDLVAQEEEEDIKADIIPVLLENNTFDGVLWSFPFNKSVPVLYYNREMFAEAGLDPDRPPETVAELQAYARLLTRDRNGRHPGEPGFLANRKDIVQWGYAQTQRNTWIFECRLLQFGVPLIAPDMRSVNYATPGGIKALRASLDMLQEHSAFAAPGYEHQNDFVARRLAMFEATVVSRVFLRDKITFDYGVGPIPGGDRKAVVVSGTNINIFDNGSPRRIQAAWEFIKWFTSTENGVTWSLETTYMPLRKSSLRSPRMQEAFRKDPLLEKLYAQLDYAYFEPRLTAWYACRNKLSQILEQVTIVGGDPQTILEQVTAELNMILAAAEEE